MKWLFKILAFVVVWAAVTLGLQFFGGLMATVDQAQVVYVGKFMVDKAVLIGFLVAVAYFIWGWVPARFEK